MYVYIGKAVGDVAGAVAADREKTAGEWVLLAVGLAVTILVTVFVTRIARQALERQVPPPTGESAAGARSADGVA